MKTFIAAVFGLVFFAACISPQKKENRPPMTITDLWISDAWQKQRLSWGYLDKKAAVWADSNNVIANHIPLNFASKFERTNFNLSFFTFAYWLKSYRQPLAITILAQQKQYYFWANIDAIDVFFWQHTANIADKKQNILFDLHCSYIDIANIKWPNQPNIDDEYSTNTCFNRQTYIAAINDSGYIFDITKFEQFRQIDTLLLENEYFHGYKNVVKIDSLLQFLHNKSTDTKIDYWITLPINLKNEADSIRLKVRGCDITNKGIVYLNGIDTIPIADKIGSVSAEYLGFNKSIDDLSILKKYLSENEPTFLYYKQNASEGSVWYNYFLAYYINFNSQGIANIQKVELIMPKRVYWYHCYPAGFCDAYSNAFFSVLNNCNSH